MTETNEERLATTKNSVQHARKFIGDDGGISFQYAEAVLDDFDWVIERAEKVPELENDIEVMSMAAGDSANELVNSQDKYKRLVESYKELTIQENAMQNNWKLAFFSAEKYKKHLDEITAAMNTERPAEEKTKDVRRILEGLK